MSEYKPNPKLWQVVDEMMSLLFERGKVRRKEFIAIFNAKCVKLDVTDAQDRVTALVEIANGMRRLWDARLKK